MKKDQIICALIVLAAAFLYFGAIVVGVILADAGIDKLLGMLH